MTYPETIDNVTSGIGAPTDPLNNPQHTAHHTVLADTVTALMNFVGTESDGRLDAPGNIKMHNTAYAPIPDGWALCDGNNGTPDLRDRFIVASGGQYTLGATGGTDSVTLATTNLPSHSHGSGNLSGGSHAHGTGNYTVANHVHASGNLSAGSHTHGSGNLNTGNHAHSHNLGSMGVTRRWTSDNAHEHSLVGNQVSGRPVPSGTTESDAPIVGAMDNHSHAHNISGNSSGAGTTVSGSTGGIGPGFSGASGNTSAGVSGNTGTTGSGTPVENRPRYYALALIMKL